MEKSGAPFRRSCLLVFLTVLALSALSGCKKSSDVRTVPGAAPSRKSISEAAASSEGAVSEKEAASMAAELDSLEAKEQSSLDASRAESAAASGESIETSKAAGNDGASLPPVPTIETSIGANGEVYPRDEYPYDIEKDRKSFDPEKIDIRIGDHHYATQINDFYTNFKDYDGKTVEIEGYYMDFGGYTLVGRRGPSCPYCTGGYVNFEFKSDQDLSKLRSEKSWIRVKGILREGTFYLTENATQKIYYIEAIELTELPEVGLDTVTD